MTTLPDVGRLGLPRPTGRYLWTLEHYPMLPHIDNLSGDDGQHPAAVVAVRAAHDRRALSATTSREQN